MSQQKIQESVNNDNASIGVLGGGQLGMMMIEAANKIDVLVHCLDPNPVAPCAKIATTFTVGDFNNYDNVYQFGKDKKVLTIEIENVNIYALEVLEREGVKVYPQPAVLKIIKDKGVQKQFYTDLNIPTAPFQLIEGKAALIERNLSYPFVQKLRVGGYDGKGVQVIRNKEELAFAFDAPSVIESMIDFEKEISIIVARNVSGQLAVFPAVECEFSKEVNLVEFQFSPANIAKEIEQKAIEIASSIIQSLELVGILAVEFFLTKQGDLLVNEIAPRTHNSGHHTIECCETSQFEQHLRAVLNLELGSTRLVCPAAMVNLLGELTYNGLAYYEGLEEVEKMPGVFVHLYGKEKTSPNRKMGHVTILGKSMEEIKAKAALVKSGLRCISK
jgi:5-(carboxyamino)imidazole ribonucleotide synthase